MLEIQAILIAVLIHIIGDQVVMMTAAGVLHMIGGAAASVKVADTFRDHTHAPPDDVMPMPESDGLVPD